MSRYMKLGTVPPKRHIKLPREKNVSYKGEGLHYEHVITTVGFDRAYSICYHLRPPTRVTKVEPAGQVKIEAAPDLPLRHVHVKSGPLARQGDPVSGRVPLFFNADVINYRCRPAQAQSELFRNATADEIIFVAEGGGQFESVFGRQPYRAGDYIVVPRTVTYRLVPDDPRREDYLILECTGDVRLPARYLNPDGQLKMGAPYAERDFHGPAELLTLDQERETPVLVKDGARLTRYTMAHHPFDVAGWDGFLYPYTFNVDDFEPITGTVHQPPPVHQTFEIPGFVVCTFAPRFLDHHPEAIKVPYAHSNVEADEVLFYVRGHFGSRKGIEQYSLTLHPRGIPHGPHPGTILASMAAERTDELAVMFDTERALHVTPQALGMEDAAYPFSWLG